MEQRSQSLFSRWVMTFLIPSAFSLVRPCMASADRACAPFTTSIAYRPKNLDTGFWRMLTCCILEEWYSGGSRKYHPAAIGDVMFAECIAFPQIRFTEYYEIDNQRHNYHSLGCDTPPWIVDKQQKAMQGQPEWRR